MSTILKALRRLEEEREAEKRDLRDQVVARPRPETGPRLPLLVVAGGIGALLVVAGFLAVDGRVFERGAAEPLASAPAPAEPAPRVARVAVAAPTVANDAVPIEVGEELAVRLPEFREPPRPAPARDEAPTVIRVSAAPPAPRVEPKPARVEAEPVARVAPAPAIAATVVPEPGPVASPPPVAAPPEAAAPPPAIVGQPEVAHRAPLPRIVVERTLWHPKPERRLAFLNVEGRAGSVELREGDALGDAVVQQIDPSAVVFLHRGVELRRRIGEGG